MPPGEKGKRKKKAIKNRKRDSESANRLSRGRKAFLFHKRERKRGQEE